MRKIDGSVFLADGARVIGDVILGKDSSVWYNAVVRGYPVQITIGSRSNVQDNAVLHGDPESPVLIGDNVTIGHSAIVHGCTIGDNTLVGMGAIIMNDARIGKNCIIGAGALVTQRKEIPDGSIVMGTPAKIVRKLTDEEIESNRKNAEEYVQLAKHFMRYSH